MRSKKIQPGASDLSSDRIDSQELKIHVYAIIFRERERVEGFLTSAAAAAVYHPSVSATILKLPMHCLFSGDANQFGLMGDASTQ